jgi:hypothetical protein
LTRRDFNLPKNACPFLAFLDPQTGKLLSEGRLPDTTPAQAKIGPGNEPRVVVFKEEEGA